MKVVATCIDRKVYILRDPSHIVSPRRVCSLHLWHCQQQCNIYPFGQVSCSQHIHPSWSSLVHSEKRKTVAKEQDACGFHGLQCNPISDASQSSPRIFHSPKAKNLQVKCKKINTKGLLLLSNYKANKVFTSRFSLMDIPRIMSNAFLTNRFLIIRTFWIRKQKSIFKLSFNLWETRKKCEIYLQHDFLGEFHVIRSMGGH